MNPLILDILKRDEGLRLKPYRCTVGRLTIGYGRNLDANGITADEAEMLLVHDIESAEVEAEKFPWYAALNDARKAVVLSMIFNLGPMKWREFVQTIRAISAGDYEDAARRMEQSRWATQVGARAGRLIRMMRNGA